MPAADARFAVLPPVAASGKITNTSTTLAASTSTTIALANTSAEAAHIRMHLDRLMRDSKPRGARNGK